MADIFELFRKIGSRESASAPLSHLVVGLGNPGPEYTETRHNAGFSALDHIAAEAGVTVDRARFHALTAEATLGERRVLLMKPQTFMNNSGEAVRAAADFYKIEPQRIVVLFDDINFEPGRIRIRRNGSAGGHRGIESIIAHLDSTDFPRIRIGVGAKPHPDYPLADWVLGRFSKAELDAVRARYADIREALLLLLEGKVEAALNRFSR